MLYKICFLWYVIQNERFQNWSYLCVNPLIVLYVRICVDPSSAGVRCCYPLTWLYVRICDVYMWHCALINYLYLFLNDFKIWLYMYLVVLYMFGKLYVIFWVKLWNQTRALFNSILLCILYNYLLDVWLASSITVFRLKCSWEYRTFGSFCKVQGRVWKL